MIDTVSAQFYGKVRPEVFKKASDQFDVTYSAKKVCSPDEEFQAQQHNSITIQHKESGLRFHAPEGGGNVRIEVALPKLLWGRNDKLITSQAEVNKAWKTVEVDMIPEFFHDIVPLYGWSYCDFTRVDATWHIQERPDTVVHLHRHARHPSIRKETQVFGTHAVVFPGVDRFLRIYDKGKEQGGKENETCRVELQMRKRALKKAFGLQEKEYLTELDGEKCYQTLRDFCMKFQRHMSDTREDAIEEWKYTVTGSFYDFMARSYVERIKWNNGENQFQTWAQGKSRKQISRVMKEAHDYVQSFRIFSWAQQLPENPNQTIMNFQEEGSNHEPKPKKSPRRQKTKA